MPRVALKVTGVLTGVFEHFPGPLHLPFELRVGDVVLEEGARLEVVDRPTTVSAGKLTRVVVRNTALNVRDERHWEAWRKVRVVREVA